MSEITLNMLEIKHLAMAAGFKVLNESGSDDMEAEMTITDCPEEGLRNDDGTRSRYKHIAYDAEYPEEGSHGLGEELKP
jgi:hypothetical protein